MWHDSSERITALLDQARHGAPFPWEDADRLFTELCEAVSFWPLRDILVWAESLPADFLNHLLTTWWPKEEAPAVYDPTDVIRAFQRAGFVTDTAGVTRPDTPLTIYRGVRSGRWGGPAEGNPRGFSWTLSETKALWYASHFGLEEHASGPVYQVTIPPEHVLGIFHGREEDEVVVDPRELQDLCVVRAASPAWPSTWLWSGVKN